MEFLSFVKDPYVTTYLNGERWDVQQYLFRQFKWS